VKLVVDTNVLVSGLFNGTGSPGKLVDAILAGELSVVCADEILAEYREVLTRTKFPFAPDDVQALLDVIETTGDWIAPPRSQFALPDETDRVFIDAARQAACPVVTGNTRHFPPGCGVEILTPAACVERLFTG
jgi:putative PIN family toxin of toxin-antitoxin system